MGLLSFVKEAGQKLFNLGSKDANAAAPAAATATAAPSQADVAALNDTAGQAILKYIKTQNLPVDNLQVSFDGASATATVSGQAQDQATKEKVVLCCGNIHSVEHVNDQMTVATPAPEAKYYTVVSGDTLSKISKQMYGDANKYNAIFEANKPMLTSPDKIYPGQMLRIPPEA
nr:peptidoglycan-binding protein LysM [uncultured Noviherbaspirillum sp.]